MTDRKIASVLSNPRNHPLYRCYCVIREMLGDRGYTIPEPEMPVEEFLELISQDAYFLAFTKSEENKPDWVIQIFFVTPDKNGGKMGKNEVQGYQKILEKNQVQAGLLVLHNIKLTSYATNEMDSYRPNYWMEAFPSSSLQVNKMHHRYVPHHRILSKQEQEALLQKYSVNVEQLQKVSHNDPISKYFAAQPGDVFEITRDSETRGEYQKYRYVY